MLHGEEAPVAPKVTESSINQNSDALLNDLLFSCVKQLLLSGMSVATVEFGFERVSPSYRPVDFVPICTVQPSAALSLNSKS